MEKILQVDNGLADDNVDHTMPHNVVSGHVQSFLWRKERDPTATVAAAKTEPAAGDSSPATNRLLAGYLAHEFLTKGTLFGKMWPPGRSEPGGGSGQSGSVEIDRSGSARIAKAYEEVAYLLKTDGVHIPGVVNPTQLARWLQM
ncbi:uncharacterized protein LOC110024933 [Phalaenopsis equestris]|uniref:uncharacterized protein LOC110024933 n=1 Tax=Phalaenopsis equestris TaxID=78828 RepID=UPI0009E1BBCD|nr:uncharacterized protein LOC110024933 [Phalaenopsis equestris]